MHRRVLSKQIQSLVRIIDRLQDQLEDQDTQDFRGNEHSFVSLSNGIHAQLADLGLNMARNGRVPSLTRSPMSTRSLISDMSTSSTVNHEHTYVSQSSFAPRPLRTRFHRAANLSPLIPSNQAPQPQVVEGPSSEAAPNISQPHVALGLLEPTEVDEGPEPAESPPQLQVEGDFVGVHSNSYLLHYNPSHDISSEQGFIITPDGPKPVTVLLDNKLAQNIISQDYAIELGLQIDLMDEDEAFSELNNIDFGDGQVEKSLGRVTLQWREGTQLGVKPFSVHCLVYEHGVRKVVLGVPFITKREHYKDRARIRAGGGVG